MNETTDATAIFAPLWRRKWLILIVGILVAAATYAYYRRQPSVYTVSTQVYLGGGSEVQALLNTTQSKRTLNERAIIDQATLINSSAVGEAVRLRLQKEHELAASRGNATAKSKAGSDFITITTEAHSARGAAQLANAYAQVYITQQFDNYRQQVKAQIASTRQQLRRIEEGETAGASTTKGTGSAKGAAPSSAKGAAPSTSSTGTPASAVIQAATLSSKISQLYSDLASPGVQQISPAKPRAAVQVSPRPRKNAIFGFVLGVLLAAIVAYTLSRFDRRLRSLGEIEALFQTQILAVLPTARRPIVRRPGREPRPARSLMEPLRRLHTSLELGDMLEHDREGAPRLILFLSPDAGDGNSTIIAGLALVQRDAGERVAVIEANLRQPIQAKLLDGEARYGLTDVLAGTIAVDEAMQRVKSLPQASSNSAGGAVGVATMLDGSVSVLVSGKAVANPPALLAGHGMADLLRSVAEDFDYALVDAPSPLAVSDVMPLLHLVGGVVLVARVGHTREVSAQRLVQLLKSVSSAPVLGVVANNVSRADLARYGFSSAQSKRGWRGLIGQ
jgi:Mrp family chromosome partitioning ATPase/capsular polysaccharide biosynthesis protein